MFLVVTSSFDRVITFYCIYLNKTFDHIVCSLKGADFVVIQKVIAISLKRATNKQRKFEYSVWLSASRLCVA